MELISEEGAYIGTKVSELGGGSQSLRLTSLRKGMNVQGHSISIRKTANWVQVLLQEKTDAARMKKHC